MVKIAIVTRPQNSSPRVLAECLNMLVPIVGSHSELFYNVNAFKRLLKHNKVSHKYGYIKWLVYRAIFFVRDKKFLKALKSFDAIIISDSTPFGFLPDTYDIERLREILGNIPILFYEVYYLGNAPTQLEKLKAQNFPTIERYHWHLSISETTEIRSKPMAPWSQIGLYLKGTGLVPTVKKGFFAIVDFAQPGYESTRNEQIMVLQQLNIPYISLEKKYPIEEIREIYRQATFYFMQSSEAFGLPIAECLCCGSYIFTPSSSWPMSWRLDEDPEVHGAGMLPACFVEYSDASELIGKLNIIREDYDFTKSPQKVFEIFLKHYPTFYEGNHEELTNVLEKVRMKELA